MRKAFLFGLGAMSMTRETAERYINEIIEKGQMSTEEARQFVEDAIKKGEDERKEIQKLIREEIGDFKKDFFLVTRAEFEALEARIKELEQKLQNQK
ncbi:MAG: phasin family protein [Syntrophomonadaceae bacterium]|jgi:polyhydroxyalkanoate synthesis regulator phasin